MNLGALYCFSKSSTYIHMHVYTYAAFSKLVSIEKAVGFYIIIIVQDIYLSNIIFCVFWEVNV